MIIGIIGAMDEEISVLKEQLELKKIVNKAGMEFFTGKLIDKDVVIVRSGIGKVNAAICTQILIDDFQVDVVINTGIAGAVNKDVNPGDVVISTDLVHHDFDAKAFGYEVGQVPRMEVFSFKADSNLVKIAHASAESISEFKAYGGRIVSGDQFIADPEKITIPRDRFDSYAVEMEGAAIAHACYPNNIPFVVIRSISDRADGSAHIDYETFKDMAIKNSIGIITNMIKNM